MASETAGLTVQRRQTYAEAFSVLPFGIAFWVIDLWAPQSIVYFMLVAGSGVAACGALSSYGQEITAGWEAESRRGHGSTMMRLVNGWTHYPITVAARRSGLPVRRMQVIWCFSVGSLFSAWLFLLIAGFAFGDDA